MGKEIAGISHQAMELLRQHDWPGNIRELENVMERAVALEPTPTILPDSLPAIIRGDAKPVIPDNTACDSFTRYRGESGLGDNKPCSGSSTGQQPSAIYRSRSLMPGEWVTFWMRQPVAKLREATRHSETLEAPFLMAAMRLMKWQGVRSESVQPRLEQRLGELQLPHNPLMGDTPLLEKRLDLLLGIFP